jgi:hypothetical protein
MTKQEMIQWLVADDLDNEVGYSREWLESVLISGFTGYAQMDNDQLYNEIEQRKECYE